MRGWFTVVIFDAVNPQSSSQCSAVMGSFKVIMSNIGSALR